MVLIIDGYVRDVRLDIVKINLKIGDKSPSTSTSTSTTSKKRISALNNPWNDNTSPRQNSLTPYPIQKHKLPYHPSPSIEKIAM